MSNKNTEDPKLWDVKKTKFYIENGLHYFGIAGIFPVNKFHGIWYPIHNGAVLFSLIVTCTLVFRDYGELVEVIHFTVLILLTEVSFIIFPKEAIRAAIRKFEEGMPFYEDTLDPKSKEEIEKIKSDVYKRKKFRVTFMKIGLVGATFSLNILRSIYDYSVGKYERPDIINGNVNRYLPVHMWCPLDVSKWYGQLFTFLLQYYNTGMTCLLIIGFTTIFMVMSEEICFHLSALKVTLRHLKRRLGKHNDGPAYIQRIQKCFKASVAHHNFIMEIFELYQHIFFWVLWLLITLCTYLLCLAGFSLTMDDLKMNDAIVMVFFLVFELLNILMVCWYGEQMKTLSEELRVALYESDWLEQRVVLKNYILIIQSRALKPIQLSCGGLIDANLETFSDVCSTAYSYFNLLRASKK